jgi:vancomycin resistance protein YoaR
MTRRRALIITGYGVGGLLALTLVLLAVLWGVQAGKVMPNTSIAGIDVSRMSPDEAATEIAPLVEMRREDPVVFTFEDQVFEIVPTDVGYRVDVDATIDAAMARGRSGFPGEIVERVRSLNTAEDLELIDTFDEAAVEDWVEATASTVDRGISSGSVTVDPDTLEVAYELPHGSAEVRRDETAVLLIEALNDPGREELELPVDTEPQRVPDEDLRSAAAQVERAVSAPMELHAIDEELILQPEQLAVIIDVVERNVGEGDTVELVVTPDALMEALEGEDLSRFSRESRDARYVSSRTPPRTFDAQGNASFSPVEADVEVEPGQDGTRFDAELAAGQITELLRVGARGGELKLERIEAGFSTQQAEQLKPSHLIGTFTTYHAAGTPRVHNIQLLADVIDGTVLLPGEQFSINEISGVRSCDKGYREDGMILRGELVDVCGGGTSQFGTTTFNAAFFAGVQLDQWKAHSWYISRYPMGREATLNYPVLDVKFTNTTPGAIIVKTTYTPSSITVSLYGQPLARTVTATHGSPTNRTDYREIRRDTDELFEDQERVVQAGAGGFTVQVTRTVDKISGSNNTQTIRTVYTPQDRIIEVGTKPRPRTDDDDEDEDEDEDDDD